jgi:hypothetical protein
MNGTSYSEPPHSKTILRPEQSYVGVGLVGVGTSYVGVEIKEICIPVGMACRFHW